VFYSVIGFLYRVDVGSVAYISEVHAASIFRMDVIRCVNVNIVDMLLSTIPTEERVWDTVLSGPALPDFLRSSGSGTGSTQPREYN
jgi:hypothetical protein